MYNPKAFFNQEEKTDDDRKTFFKTIKIKSNCNSSPIRIVDKKTKKVLVKRKVKVDNNASLDSLKKMIISAGA